ncbi:Muramidase (phage lambda lysozyme) [Noviherbaspirillum humi]|uniref:Muramidase (Phage lambda lysozyme) n=1 Tax=Noviherbaspirillum humi TaxID=1688639 RepID=A0A239LN69_9BURK|nr:hypothetical protein [Noviherbaspirillum humi]SNT32117.1 Muramidase (phage lambda lysozyme) [Noviherbaspirillum humi]
MLKEKETGMPSNEDRSMEPMPITAVPPESERSDDDFSSDRPPESGPPNAATTQDKPAVHETPIFEDEASGQPFEAMEPPIREWRGPLEGMLELRVNDWHGQPIPHLAIRVMNNKKVVFDGKTDAKGQVPSITGLKINTTFEIHVRRDSGKYKFAAIGKIHGEENYACLQSPKTRFEFSTEPHTGGPGNADTQKDKIAASHNQKPAAQPVITGNPDKKPELEAGRNKDGYPKATVLDGLRNFLNQNRDDLVPATATSSDIEVAKRLIEFAEKQACWEYSHGITSDAYVKQMQNKTFVEPSAKPKRSSKGMCNKYVKIALWYAYHVGDDLKLIGSGVSPARLMGKALLDAGFKEISSELPDARWAAPGDVIVYEKKGSPSADGHIDIRTYDGYISDFWTPNFPVQRFKVIGIYRKCYDPMPAKRMRAFLMTIASREAEQIFTNDGYEEAYRTLPRTGKFNDFTSHPFANNRKAPNASGAYGILESTWRLYLPYVEVGPDGLTFSPRMQDCLAIAIMEQVENVLKLVRTGEIEAAATILAKRDWPSFPGGSQSGRYTKEQMLANFNRFLGQMK